ncbi:DNA polymerase III subunit beta [Shinella pollutisoli]|uniref:Beta sliding clamp n=1 Tax=Shinella pollutisoli TaxID=2250594 RepID=A0ABV7D9L3_9HYPH|nr:DNA polymerase III subunit beta [Shinella pollutisoli]
MRLQTTAGQLRAGLRALQGIVGPHYTAPILSTVKLGGGRLVGASLDARLSVALPSIGAMEGEVAIDHRALRALAASVDRDVVLTIDGSGERAAVTFGGSEYRMPSLAADAFPADPEIEGERAATGNLGLVAAIRRVLFAMSREETRYYLNGVAILVDPDGQALVAATDGHRLATCPLDVAPEGSRGLIVPAPIAGWLSRQGREPEACVFDPGRKRARFELAGMTLSARLIDGTYPDVFRVIPKDARPALVVDRQMLLRALRRIRAFSPYSFKGVRLLAEGGHLTVTMSDAGEGCAAREAVPLAEGHAVGAFDAGYNVGYLCSALAALQGDLVTVSAPASPGGSPAVFTAEGDRLRVVQMPMRV